MSTDGHVIVTGGAGMIGSNLVKRLVASGHKVCVIDNLWRGKLQHLYEDDGRPVIDIEKDFHNIDLSVPGICDHLIKNADYVYHLADVVAGIDYVFRNEGAVFRQNMLINSNVIDAVRKNRVKGFIYVGTACSFPADKQTGVDAPPLREVDQFPAAPESAYGWSKLMGEYESLLMEKETGTPTSVLIVHNVYGTPCDYSESTGQVIPSLARKAIRYPDEQFVVWGGGSQGRAFVYVDDVVEALVLAMDKGLGRKPIQIGPDVCTPISEVAEAIVDISGKDIEINYDESKPEGDKGRKADYGRARRLLGWEPRVEIKDGLERLYRWIEREILRKKTVRQLIRYCKN